MLDGQNIYVFDIEVKKSPDDCRHCGKTLSEHYDSGACEPWSGEKPSDDINQFSQLGWNNKALLGISIGCYFSYKTMQFGWFDEWTLAATMSEWVDEQPLLVGFNSIAFDAPLMRGLLRQEGDTLRLSDAHMDVAQGDALITLCDAFKVLCATSYDILAAIWQADPTRKFERGLNSLGAISEANGYGTKAMDGAAAPRLWAQGRYAEVIAYNVADVLKTKALFEQIVATGSLLRGDGRPLALPGPQLPS